MPGWNFEPWRLQGCSSGVVSIYPGLRVICNSFLDFLSLISTLKSCRNIHGYLDIKPKDVLSLEPASKTAYKNLDRLHTSKFEIGDSSGGSAPTNCLRRKLLCHNQPRELLFIFLSTNTLRDIEIRGSCLDSNWDTGSATSHHAPATFTVPIYIPRRCSFPRCCGVDIAAGDCIRHCCAIRKLLPHSQESQEPTKCRLCRQ